MKALGTVAPEVMVEIVDAGGLSVGLKGRVSDRHTRQGSSLHLLRPHPWSAETVSAPGPTRSAPVGGFSLGSSRAVGNDQEHTAELPQAWQHRVLRLLLRNPGRLLTVATPCTGTFRPRPLRTDSAPFIVDTDERR